MFILCVMDFIVEIAPFTEGNLNITARDIIFNMVHHDVSNIANTIVLYMKMYIYRCKWNDTVPNMQGFETEIYRMWNIEKYNVIKMATLRNITKSGTMYTCNMEQI